MKHCKIFFTSDPHFGHVHEKWKVKGKSINVGVDRWNFKPVVASEIIKIINGGKKT